MSLALLIEFAFALDPHVASRTGLPRGVLWDIADDPHFAVEFARPPEPTGLVYLTRVTGDYHNWSPGSYETSRRGRVGCSVWFGVSASFNKHEKVE